MPLEIISLARGTAHGTADQLSTVRAEAAARRLAPRYAGDEPEARDVFSASTELVDLLGQGDVRDLDPEAAWRPRLQRDRLRVPIGVDEAGAVVALDIKESAQQGMGPHGLVIGATGSGKSELLRTLVLALSMTHSPEALNFVLVDFKGGATFAGMADLPHVSAVITNLGQEITLVERMQDALQGEMTRRQELLRSAGNFANVTDYERRPRQGPRSSRCRRCSSWPTSSPSCSRQSPSSPTCSWRSAGSALAVDAPAALVPAARGGPAARAGVAPVLPHRPAHLLGRRVAHGIGVPDAYELPPVPGLGYLKPDQTTLTKFKAAYVSGPPKGRRRRAATTDGPGRRPRSSRTRSRPVAAGRRGTDLPRRPPGRGGAGGDARGLRHRGGRMKGHGRPAHQVWLPPLDVPNSMDQLLGDLGTAPRARVW